MNAAYPVVKRMSSCKKNIFEAQGDSPYLSNTDRLALRKVLNVIETEDDGMLVNFNTARVHPSQKLHGEMLCDSYSESHDLSVIKEHEEPR